jgi:hypothetical protein
MSQGTKVNNRTRTGAPKKRDYGPTTENYPLSEAQGTAKFLQAAGESGLQAIDVNLGRLSTAGRVSPKHFRKIGLMLFFRAENCP